MKKTNKISLILCSVLFASWNANAFELVDGSPYVSAALGIYGAGQDNNPFNNIFDNDDDIRGAARLAAGYEWDLHNKFKVGFEAGINGFQDHEQDATIITPDDTTLTYRRFSADILAVIDYYIVPCVDLFIKGGPVFVHQEASAEHTTVAISNDDNGVTGKLAIGLGYAFTHKINVNLTLAHEFERDHGYRDVDSFPSASSLLLGVNYFFC